MKILIIQMVLHNDFYFNITKMKYLMLDFEEMK
jgi:hypothetical protein